MAVFRSCKKLLLAYDNEYALICAGALMDFKKETYSIQAAAYIRSLIRAQYGARIARSVTIQYGGSMKGSNAHELLSHEDIDGGLIGGASLDPKALMEIVHAANQE